MPPYVIRQGDHLRKLAARLGFDADDVWNDPKNDALRKKRDDMNILAPCDVIELPDVPPSWLPITPGSTNTFLATLPIVPVNVVLTYLGAPLAGATCTVRELPYLGELETSATGALSFDVPATLGVATVDLPELDAFLELEIGNLDPIDEWTGLLQRLLNLGLVFYDDAERGEDLGPELLATALAAFQLGEGSPDPTGARDDETLVKVKKAHGS